MNMKPLKGQHHVSAITANAQKNYAFYTRILGMRLVKKTVNQDDTTMYHLFYADERGNPGTDLTFFEIKNAGRTYRGTDSITCTFLRVPSDESLLYWKKRLSEQDVLHEEIREANGKKMLFFEDFEGQRLALISDQNNKGVKGGRPWDRAAVPPNHGIIGLGPVMLTVSELEPTANLLTEVMEYRRIGEYSLDEDTVVVFETGEGGNGAEIHIKERHDLPKQRPGRGSVHHVAFRVENEEELRNWVRKLKELRIASSGFVERYYFKSLYFREPNGILFELATDGPGFEADEPFDQLGEKLALPPYIENRREEIEAKIKPLDTKNE
ncbi:ring-cleaving dioxygenase [Cytobacillus firmus]|uniref:ring-cleaving dioxygenase n=1 Tax=Cytobacillus firmus TaxID=1399 RepID=UPI001C8EB26B|nr:ring-cleaving dioxygenase [Cytobacillus firmus]MBX9973845.1 ring-cleaving dioxygenase [Cytobacillus firmus]